MTTLLLGVCALGLLGATPSLAAIPAPHWLITAAPEPTYFKPGDTADVYTSMAINDGSQPTDGSVVTVAVTLPGGVTATEIRGHDQDVNEPMECTLVTLTCINPNNANIAPGDVLIVTVRVSVAVSMPASVTASASVSGGGAPNASTSGPITISSLPVPFGLSYLSTDITDSAGNPDTQAGSHPFEMTTSFAFNSSSLEEPEGFPLLNAAVKDIEVALPPGLVGDPGAVPQCSQTTFQATGSPFGCPTDTQVGMVRVFFYGSGTATQTVPVYNVAPPPDQPAELGFTISALGHIPMFFHVRSDGNYGLTAQLANITEVAPAQAAIFTLWGVPADPSHDSRRQGPGCETNAGCPSFVDARPFLTLPASCQGSPLGVSLASDSWQSPGQFVSTPSAIPALTGCGRLSLAPAIGVHPETTQAAAPSGYTVDIQVPQNDDPSGLATPNLKNVTVTLPAGTVVSPSAANGLQGCSDDASSPSGDQFGLRLLAPAVCPQASQIGTVAIHSPLLSKPLEGQVFLGQPNCAPCTPTDAQNGSMIRLFLQVRGSGVLVKLEGHSSLDQVTGQIITTFAENPQLPFDELKLTLNGGARAPLANPSVCGPAVTTTQMTPWSSPFTPDAAPSSFFEVTGCGPAQFSPSFMAGTTSNQAGGFSPFSLALSRTDQDQDLGQLSVHMPPGLLALLAKVTLCGEAQAAAGACPAASQIGHMTVAAGAGSDPLPVPQPGKPQAPVFLTGPYKGAPFGLSIVVPAQAGPFDLGTVVVRSAIYIDSHTAQATIVSDPLPQIQQGIPLHIRSVNVAVDREGFVFNPTSCEPLAVTGTLVSTLAASANVSTRFQAANCASLRFKPKFTVSTQGSTSKKNGASLNVKVTSGPGQANIGKAVVSLPKQLPARLTTLQQACPEATFAANPASCPANSNVGTAKAVTPVLNAPLTGPAYLVSHGGAAFPDLVVVLQGQGIRLDLIGNTNIKKGITTSSFNSVPDAPISSFQLKLPAGSHSALAANLPAAAKRRLCGAKLVMPTTLTGQNGARLKQSTRIAITGCPRKARIHAGRRARRRHGRQH